MPVRLDARSANFSRDFAGLLDADPLVLAHLGVLFGELVAQLAPLRIEDHRIRDDETGIMIKQRHQQVWQRENQGLRIGNLRHSGKGIGIPQRQFAAAQSLCQK